MGSRNDTEGSQPGPRRRKPEAGGGSASGARVRSVFVTVGSTRFDALVEAVLRAPVLEELRAAGAEALVVQHGASPVPGGGDGAAAEACAAAGLSLELFAYEPGIGARLRAADLIVSHAGAGTLFEALALGKRVVAVANHALADDHQSELARALHDANHLVAADVPVVPVAVARAVRATFAPLRPRDRRVLPAVLAQELVML